MVFAPQARAKELRLELLNSKRLQAHFEEHPADLALLKHDKPLAKAAAPPHLKHIPAYLKDASSAAGRSYAGNAGPGGPRVCMREWHGRLWSMHASQLETCSMASRVRFLCSACFRQPGCVADGLAAACR
jgi:hypothetical protein